MIKIIVPPPIIPKAPPVIKDKSNHRFLIEMGWIFGPFIMLTLILIGVPVIMLLLIFSPIAIPILIAWLLLGKPKWFYWVKPPVQ